jgi:hypothetical protein
MRIVREGLCIGLLLLGSGMAQAQGREPRWSFRLGTGFPQKEATKTLLGKSAGAFGFSYDLGQLKSATPTTYGLYIDSLMRSDDRSLADGSKTKLTGLWRLWGASEVSTQRRDEWEGSGVCGAGSRILHGDDPGGKSPDIGQYHDGQLCFERRHSVWCASLCGAAPRGAVLCGGRVHMDRLVSIDTRTHGHEQCKPEPGSSLLAV